MNTLNVNGREHTLDADPTTPILWALRDTLGMTGTKFGCGAALCGACAGFLPHNVYPARMFMGDSGSMLLGFVLAGSAVTLTGHPPPGSGS